MGEDDASLFFLRKGDRFPTVSLNFVIASSRYAEDLWMPNGTNVVFDGSVAGFGNGRSSTDHIDLPIQ